MKKIINDKLLQNYNKILVKVNSSINKEFSSEPEENGKYVRLKVKPEKGKIKAFFHYVEIGKEDFDCICWSLILIDSVVEKDENYYSQIFENDVNTVLKKPRKYIIKKMNTFDESD